MFSYGVVVLSLLAGALLITFGGVTDRLIPLFAVGAFLAFTLSQAGMVVHFRRGKEPNKTRAMWVNGVGAAATGVTLVVVVISKFVEGAYLAVVVVPTLVFVFSRIHRHYQRVQSAVKDDEPLDLTRADPPIVVVPVQSWNKLASRSLRFAMELSPEVHALHILPGDETICELTCVWEELACAPARAAGKQPPHLVLRRSTYRQFFGPIIEYVEQMRDEHPTRDIVVIVPDLVVRRWYHALLHNNRGLLLKSLLRLRGGPRVMVMNAPFYLQA